MPVQFRSIPRLLDLIIAAVILICAIVLQASNLPVLEFLLPVTGSVFLLGTLYSVYVLLSAFLRPSFELLLRIALTIALFFAVTTAIGMVFDLLSVRVERLTWMFGYAILASIALTVTGIWRIHKMPNNDDEVSWTLGAAQYILFTLAAILLIGAFLLAREGLSAAPASTFSQFWMLSQPSEDGFVSGEIGVWSAEEDATTYSIQLISNGQIIEEWTNIRLLPHEEWDTQFEVPAADIVFPLESRLYIEGQITPYRYVKLWPDSGPSVPSN